VKNPVKEKLLSGKPSYGAWLNLCSPLAAEVVASSGFEWCNVDAEHSADDLGLISDTFRAIEAHGVVPFVRAWDHDPVTLARLLDAGAMGIVIPHVSTPEQAEALAKAMRYPPRGSRSAGTGRIAVYGDDYRSSIDDQVLVIPQIEDPEGIANTEAIMSVEGIDVGFLGPGDLSLAMGVQQGDPAHEEAIQQFLAGCKKAGVPCGMPARTVDAARERAGQGFQMLDILSDLRSLQAEAQGMIQAVS
jgi:4-hydroxy-2-oxoheptanedioate aldolase